MHPTKLLMAILAVLAFSASLATAAPHSKGKGYTTATAHQAKFQISY
jgi:hypothetical protein